jgi:3-oxoacyl-[acyl-carrier-protein] synthase-3
VNIGIERVAGYMPEHRLTAADLAARYGFDEEFIRGKLGVEQVFIASDAQRTSDLAVAAVERLLGDRPGLAESVGLLVVCTQTPDYQLPQVAAMVQDRAGLPGSTASFDISLGCSGWVYGLSIVESFMRQHRIDYGLLVTAETYSKVIDDGDRNTKCLFSDAAAATLLGPDGQLRSGRFTFGTAGKGFDQLIVRRTQSVPGGRLFMDGRGIFEFVLGSVPVDVRRCLALNDVTMEDLDLLVFHQASGFLLDAVAKQLGISGDPRVLRTIRVHGNAVSSSIPLALLHHLGPELTGAGRVLVSGFGVGLSWASTILEARQ